MDWRRVIFFVWAGFLYPLQEYYEKGDFTSCIEKAAQLGTNKLSRIDKFYYAECLFLSRKIEKAFALYESILEKKDKISEQAYLRMVDIFLQQEKKEYIETLFKNFPENLQENYTLNRLIRYFLQKNLWADFKRFYLIAPIALSKEEWQKIFLQGKSFSQEILEKSPYSAEEKNILHIELALSIADYETAEKLVNNSTFPKAKKNYFFFVLEVHKKNPQKAYEIISPLCEENPTYCSQGADLFFEKGYPASAINLLEIAETKQVFFTEKKIFFLLAMKKYENAIIELEKAHDKEKVSLYLYQHLLNKIMKHLGPKVFYSYVDQTQLKDNQKCKLKIEALFTHGSDFLDEEIQQVVLKCPQITEKENIHRLFYSLLNQERYFLILKLWKSSYENDFNLSKIYLKTLVETQDYQKALVFLEKLYPSRENPPEVLLEKAKIYFYLKNFAEAKNILENLNYEDSREYYLECLLALQDFSKLQEQLENISTREKNYYLAIWSLAQNQIVQAEKLLEQYLEDPGKKGNQAVYLLFTLRYFSQEDERGKVAFLISRFPYFIEEKDFLEFPWLFTEKPQPKTELEVFVLYHYVRYLLSIPKEINRAKEIIEDVKQNPQSRFLREEILFLLAQINQQKSILINEFPLSPFRLLMK